MRKMKELLKFGGYGAGIALGIFLIIHFAFAAGQTIGPVDFFITMNTSTIGSQITTSTLTAGTVASTSNANWSWAITSTTAMSIGTSSHSLMVPIIVSSTTYPTSTVSRTIAYNHNFADQTAQLTLPTGHNAATVAGWVTFGPPNVGASSSLFDYVLILGALDGRYAALQLSNGNGVPGGAYTIKIETNPGGAVQRSTSSITVVPSSTYWFSLKGDYTAGIASLALYNTSGTQVGNTVTTTMATGENAGTIFLGNNESGTASSTSYFENVVVDTTNAAFPLGPGIILPGVNSFTASPTTPVGVGGVGTLSWNVTNASSVVITGNNLNLTTSTASGTFSVSPSASGTDIYTLLATNPNGSSTATSSLNVNAGTFFVQSSTHQVFSGLTNTVSFPNNVTANNFIALAFEGNMASATSSCSSPLTVVAASTSLSLAYGMITSSGTCSVTVTNSTSGLSEVIVHEVGGVNTVTPLDVTSTRGNGGFNSNPFSSGTSTTKVAGDYIFGYGTGGTNVTFTPGAGYSLEVNGAKGATEDQVQSTAGPISASFTPNASNFYTAGMMALEPTAGSTLPRRIILGHGVTR